MRDAKALGFWDMQRNQDIFEIQRELINCFNYQLYRIYGEMRKENDTSINDDSPKPNYDLASIYNYNFFNSRYPRAKTIRYNSKDVTYEECIDLRDHFIKYYQEMKEFRNRTKDKPSLPDCDKGAKIDAEDIELYELKDYLNFFGPGEFPMMFFVIVRIGNKQYSFYTIER